MSAFLQHSGEIGNTLAETSMDRALAITNEKHQADLFSPSYWPSEGAGTGRLLYPHTPTRILFGKGAIAGFTRTNSSRCSRIVTYGGGSVKKTGVLDQVLDALKGMDVLELAVLSQSRL
ncbi:hypothetical protein ACNKHX_18500 [Shigella flexneri]